jgi:hypothetical protein
MAGPDPDRHAPTLRLLAEGGRVVTSRPRIVAAAARARRGGRVYTLWPDARRPMLSADMGYPRAADWLRRTIVPTLRRLPDAATWMSLRAGAALVDGREGLAARLGMRVMRQAPPPRVALFSPSGQPVSKVICFLFRVGDAEPRTVVKAMADPAFDWRLRAELDVLQSIRHGVAHDARVARTLPSEPLFAGEDGGEFVLVESFDRLATATGSGTRSLAFDWLRDFQAASFRGDRPWDAADEQSALLAVRDAWRLAGRATDDDAVVTRVRELLAPIRGTPVPRCAVHGDFWRDNIAARDGWIRVYDWEWAALDGSPLVDLWTYDLAELRVAARRGDRALEDRLREALARVEDELRARGLDDRLALGMLAPVLGALSFRIRTRLAMPDEMEPHSISLMTAVERLLAAP